MMTAVQQRTAETILATIEGEVFVNGNGHGDEGNDILIVGNGFVIAIDWEGNTSEATVGEWQTGWTA